MTLTTFFRTTLHKPGRRFTRSAIAALSAAVIGLAFVSTAASARPGGGFRGGGFHGGFHGGFRGGGFRPGFRAFGPAFGFTYGIGYPYYAGYYGYGYDDCWRPRRVWTPYGPRVRLVNVCGYGYY
jgi:hypothetical protein